MTVSSCPPTVLGTIAKALLPAERTEVEPTGPQAAVAVVLLARDADIDVLLIRRADRPGDHWSGHMAFPGGRRSSDDADLLATAIRETREEVGLDLARDGDVLGRLVDIAALNRLGRATGMVVRPFVFSIAREPTLVVNHEVVEALWAPVGPMLHGEVDTTIDYAIEDRTYT